MPHRRPQVGRSSETLHARTDDLSKAEQAFPGDRVLVFSKKSENRDFPYRGVMSCGPRIRFARYSLAIVCWSIISVFMSCRDPDRTACTMPRVLGLFNSIPQTDNTPAFFQNPCSSSSWSPHWRITILLWRSPTPLDQAQPTFSAHSPSAWYSLR